MLENIINFPEKVKRWTIENISQPLKKHIEYTKAEVYSIIPFTDESTIREEYNLNNSEISELIKELDSDIQWTFKDTQSAINWALSRNSLNITSNFLDAFPIQTPHWIGLIFFILSIIWSLNDFYYRQSRLNPLMEKSRNIYHESTNISPIAIKKHPILNNLDIEIEVLESIIEILLPFLLPVSIILPIVETLVDTRNRKKYYQNSTELHAMLKTIHSYKSVKLNKNKTPS